MPSYTGNAFTLEEAHAAADTAGFKPTRLGNRGPVQFQLRSLPRRRRHTRRLLGNRKGRTGVFPLPPARRG